MIAIQLSSLEKYRGGLFGKQFVEQGVNCNDSGMFIYFMTGVRSWRRFVIKLLIEVKVFDDVR